MLAGKRWLPGQATTGGMLRGLADFVEGSGAPDDRGPGVRRGRRPVRAARLVGAGEDHGLLADETLGFLRDQLAAVPAGTALLVCFHHPLVEVGHPVTDYEDVRRAPAGRRYWPSSLQHHQHTRQRCDATLKQHMAVAPGIRSMVPLLGATAAHTHC